MFFTVRRECKVLSLRGTIIPGNYVLSLNLVISRAPNNHYGDAFSPVIVRGRSAAIIVASGDSTASELLKQIAVHAATNNPTSLDGDPKVRAPLDRSASPPFLLPLFVGLCSDGLYVQPDFDRPDRLPHPLLHQPFLFDDSQTILQVREKNRP